MAIFFNADMLSGGRIMQKSFRNRRPDKILFISAI